MMRTLAGVRPLCTNILELGHVYLIFCSGVIVSYQSETALPKDAGKVLELPSAQHPQDRDAHAVTLPIPEAWLSSPYSTPYYWQNRKSLKTPRLPVGIDSPFCWH